VKIAYADPPYPGQAKKHYQSEEVDHLKLIAQLKEYDGWALSTSSVALQDVLAMCPKGVRVMAWVKPFCIFKPNVNPAYAWEPVIVSPARKLTREAPTVRDWVSCNITLKKGLVGVKPGSFSQWLFSVLGARPEDEFFDLFPGSGAVTRVWQSFQGESLTLTLQ